MLRDERKRGLEGQEQVLTGIVCGVLELELHPKGEEEQWPGKNSGLGPICRNRSSLSTHGWASGYINLMAFEWGEGLLISPNSQQVLRSQVVKNICVRHCVASC